MKGQLMNEATGQPYDNMIAGLLIDRLKLSEYWAAKTRMNENSIQGLICPQCGRARAWAYKDKPHSINCNRLNQCGARTKTLTLFPDVIPNVETSHPPTRQDPLQPATFYLKLRGLVKSLKGMDYEYWPDIRKTGSGGVMFPVIRPDGTRIYNGRIFNPPEGAGKTHNRGEARPALFGSIRASLMILLSKPLLPKALLMPIL